MLCGKLPYGEEDPGSRRNKRPYRSAMTYRSDLTRWIDGALEKSVQKNPNHRYETLSEFLYDLSHPNQDFLKKDAAPLLERNPLVFWQSLTFILLLTNLMLLFFLFR